MIAPVQTRAKRSGSKTTSSAASLGTWERRARPFAVNGPGDAHEQEAKRNAYAVGSDAPVNGFSFSRVSVFGLQRKCACGGTPGPDGECAECRKKRLQRKASNHTEPSSVPPIVHDVLRSPGQPLDADTRAFMEPRFGHDFSQVRVHTDARAAQSARAVNALAYTVGRDVVFAEGQFDRSAEQGRMLLAHELTHTIQQSAYASAAVTPHDQITIEPADTAFERAADESASRLTTNSGMMSPTPGIALQRAPAPQAKSAPALDERKRTHQSYAFHVHGKKDADRIRHSGKLTPEHKQEIIAKIRFFQGKAKAAYIQAISPALIDHANEEVREIVNVSALPAEALEVSCDVGKHQYLLQYEGEYWKNRCVDTMTDPEFLSSYFDRKIKGAEGYAVEGTTWENVEYSRFKVMRVKYEDGTFEYFMLNEIGDFHYAETTAVIREFTYVKRSNGKIYPVREGQLYLVEFTTPRLLTYKNGLKHQIVELQRLYELLQIAGTFASILGDYSAVGGGPEPSFRSSLEGFTRHKGTRTPTTTPSTTRKGGTRTDEPPPTSMTLPEKATKAPTTQQTKQIKTPPKQPGKHEGEETRTTVVSRTDDDPTSFKGGKKTPAKKGGKEQKEGKASKVASKKRDEPEDPKGGKERETADEPKKPPTAPKAQTPPDDPQRGVKDAIARANQRIAERQKDIEAYNKQIVEARGKEESLRQQAKDTPRDDPGRPKILQDQKKAKEDLDELVGRRDHAASENQKDQATAIRLQKALDAKTYERPGDFHAGVREQVWQNALKEGNGKVLSPSGTEIKPGDPWVMGHKPKYEFWKHQRSAAQRGITREQFIKEHNDAKHYRPETKKDNESHFYEDKTDAYLGY